MSLSEHWLDKAAKWGDELSLKYVVDKLNREEKQFFIGSLDAVVLHTSDDELAAALKASGHPLLTDVLAGYRGEIRTWVSTDTDFSAAFNEYAATKKAVDATFDKYAGKGSIVNRVLAIGTALANIGDLLKMFKQQDQLYKQYQKARSAARGVDR
jgi:hypothetical protein